MLAYGFPAAAGPASAGKAAICRSTCSSAFCFCSRRRGFSVSANSSLRMPGISSEPATADRVVAMVEEAIELTRNLARTLHPIGLGADGLVEALQNLVANLSKAFNVSCRLQHSGTVVLNDPKAGIHLYRIAQEAVSNAIKHGKAKEIVIQLNTAGGTVLTVSAPIKLSM